MAESSSDARDVVRSLKEKIRGWERDHRPPAEIVSSGCPAFDRLLADGGFCRGTLVEWLAAGSGSGAATLALAIAARACREGGTLVVIDRPRMFYPPAAGGFGIDPEWIVVVRPQSECDEAWALDQVLRSSGVGSVLAWPRKLTERRFRQMQLAAEVGGSLGMLVRPERARDEPSWAELRLWVMSQGSGVGGQGSGIVGHAVHAGRSVGLSPRVQEGTWAEAHATLRQSGAPSAGRRLLVELLRSRGGFAGGKMELELDERTGVLHESHAEHLAPRLAAPAARSRSTGA